MSVFEMNSGRLALIYQKPYPYSSFILFDEVLYKENSDFVKENHQEISIKQFRNVLKPYFETEFGFTSEGFDEEKEENWFIERINQWNDDTEQDNECYIHKDKGKKRKHCSSLYIERHRSEFKRVKMY